MDVQEWERPAIEYGGQCGGEYLESIGVFDLRELSAEQWRTFCEVIALNYSIKRSELEPCPF